MMVEPFLAWVGGESGARRVAALPGPDWLKARRRLALGRAGMLGLPTRRNEAWKYTDIAGLAEIGYQPAERPDGVAPDHAARVDNGFITALPAGLPEGVSCRRLSDPDAAATVEPLLARVLDYEDKPIAAFNTALFHDGILLRIERGVTVDRPIELIATGQGEKVEFYPRLMVVVEPGASAVLVERHHGSGVTLSNPVSELILGEGAHLRHYRLQDESEGAVHLATSGLRLGRGARYNGVELQMGGRLARHEVHVALNGAGASFTLDGAIVGAGHQHLDMTTFVTHRAPGCTSRQTFKSVLADQARGVVLGKIRVEPRAQKTDAYQLSQALLLSRQAEMDGRPELEIYADDVKCGHGASVGELDEAALFYLRSRAVDEATARRLLMEGFLAEVVDRIEADGVHELFAAVMAGHLQRIAIEEES